MPDASLIGPWIRRFLLEHLISERNLARNTQRSYRDTLQLLLPFVARYARKPVDRLAVTDVSADCVRQFLSDLEEGRGCAVATRNQRLAALHALARFIGLHAPDHRSEHPVELFRITDLGEGDMTSGPSNIRQGSTTRTNNRNAHGKRVETCV